MAKINITVEMNEEEYECYKGFIEGKYLENTIKNMSITDFLSKQGYAKIDSETNDGFFNGRKSISTLYESKNSKVKTKILVRVEE